MVSDQVDRDLLEKMNFDVDDMTQWASKSLYDKHCQNPIISGRFSIPYPRIVSQDTCSPWILACI